MGRVKVFIIDHTGWSRYTLRRYRASSQNDKCSGPMGYHNAHSPVIAETQDDPSKIYYCSNPPSEPAHDDPRWPTKCDGCDYRFAEEDVFQVRGQALYKRQDNGEITTLEDAPPGALWDATWWPLKTQDGKVWTLRCPGGADWMIDGKANNCNCPPPELDPNHFCWVRSGTAPELTANPSIATHNYHGWLRNGWLEEC